MARFLPSGVCSVRLTAHLRPVIWGSDPVAAVVPATARQLDFLASLDGGGGHENLSQAASQVAQQDAK